MHVLFLTFHLPGPDEPGAARPWEELQLMQELGWEVTVITASAHYLTGEIRHPVRGLWKTERNGRTTIVRTWSPARYRSSTWRRLSCYLAFSAIAPLAGTMVPSVDAVLAGTDPPFMTPGASLLALVHRAALVLDERDVYPETALAVGMTPPRLLVAVLSLWNRLLRRQASSVITVSPGLRELLIERGTDVDRTVVVPNYFPPAEVRDQPPPGRSSRDGAATVLYAGSLGQATNVESCLDAVEVLAQRGYRTIRFVFLGAGERRQEYIERCDAHGLDNVTFPGTLPRSTMDRAFAEADIALHSFARHPYWRRALSSKIFEYMANSLPVVFAGEGDIAQVLCESGGGIHVPPEDPTALADAIARLADNPELRAEMGARGRQYVLERFKRERTRGDFARAFLFRGRATSRDDPGGQTACTDTSRRGVELARLRTVYAARTEDAHVKERYRLENRGNAFNLAERRRALRELLHHHFPGGLAELDVLDIGCGYGDFIDDLSGYEMDPCRFWGVDLMPDRVALASEHHPESHFVTASADNLPFPEKRFDMVCQLALMTSIRDSGVKQSIAREIDRVLRPGGKILWYDYWINPLNRETRGIRISELRRLFPGYTVDSRQITLAPPLARAVGSRLPSLYPVLAAVKMLRTHHLALLTKSS